MIQKINEDYEEDTNDQKMYRIISKNCGLALRPQIRQKKNQDDQIRIMGTIEDEKSIQQLWMFKTIKDNKKQIVNFWTDFVIENDNGDVKLQRGKQKIGQRFEIQFVRANILKNKQHKAKEIRIKDSNNLYLTLDGTLEVGKLDESDQTQIYRLIKVDISLYKQFQQTYEIIETISKKCLDVTKGETTIGSTISLYFPNQRANQRWIFQPQLKIDDKQDQKYSIINLLSGLRLWYDKKGGLIQADNRDRIWQLKGKMGQQALLYCSQKKKFITRIASLKEQQLKLQNNHNNTAWKFQAGF